ncbi:MAG: DotA/TraY family protein [Gammaproteobacteria bacterium]|nr:DotA/TraY family protein [Gammaproteobacteria bacterium]
MKDLDLVVLAFVTVMVFITMAIGATSTAHEGKAFGNRYHALWTPLRSAFAMVLLAPIPGVGLSLIQGALLLMVWFSIGGANYLASQATTYMAKNGGQLTSIAPGGGRLLSKEILQSELAVQFFINYEKAKINPIYTVSPWRPDPLTASDASLGPTAVQNDPGHYTITFNTSGVQAASGAMNLWGFIHTSGVTPGQFGKITIDCASQSSPMCTAQLSAVEQMIATESPYVQSLVNSSQAAAGSSSTATSNKAAATGPTLTDPTIVKAAQAYDAAMYTAEQQVLAQAHPNLMAAMNNINTSVTHLGWWSLGMYYWDIAHVNAGIQAQIGKMPQWSGYNQAAIDKAMSSKSDIKTFTKIEVAAGAGLQAAQSATGGGVSSSLLTKIFASQGAWYAQIPAWALLKGDPLSNLQTAGDIAMAGATTAMGAYILARTVSGAANGESRTLGVFGAGSSWLTGGANSGLKAAASYVLMLVVGIFVVGAIWAYYLPSVPFILWTMAIIGWLIFIVEALVGSVIWAAGIALPEGEGIFGPRGDQGVMLFLNVMFRPSLMVIGFFASFLLINSIGSLVGGSFAVFMGGMYPTFGGSSVSQGGSVMHHVADTAMALSPITWVATAIIISIIALTMTHKIFGLITWIPENVMRWVGGQGVQLGEGGDEQQTRQSFAGGFAAVKDGGVAAKSADAARDEKAAKDALAKQAEKNGGEHAAQASSEKTNDVADGGEKPPP